MIFSLFNIPEAFSVIFPKDKESSEFHCYIVNKNQGSLSVNSYAGTMSLYAIKEKFNDVPVILNIFNSNVIYTSNKSIFDGVLDEFYITEYKTESSSVDSLYSLARREYVNNLKDNVSKAKLNLVKVDLGCFSINVLYGQEFTDQQVKLGSYLIKYDEVDCIGVEALEECNLVDQIENFVLALTLEYISHNEKLDTNLKFKSLERNRSEFRDKRIVKQLVKYGFSILFILVSFFYLLGLFFNQKNAQSMSEKNGVVIQQKKITSLKQEYLQKKNLIVALGLQRKHSHIYFINKIISLLPSSTRLSEFSIAPVLKTIVDKKKVIIDKKIMIIKGEVDDKKSFGQWIESVQQLEGVSEVHITKFENKNKDTDFELVVKLN